MKAIQALKAYQTSTTKLVAYSLFFILYLLALVSATPVLQFQHEETQPDETIMATISTPGEFIKQIEPSDIKFFKGRKQISLESDITFYAGKHYLYIYATKEGVFTLQIENILYKEADILQSITISKEFNISKNILINEKTNETSTQILTIKPGFVFTTLTRSIKLINSGTSTLNLTYDKNETSLAPLESQEITFTPEAIFTTLNISTYKEFQIPIIYPIVNITPEPPIVNITPEPPIAKLNLKQNPELLLAETFTETKSQEIIELFNLGNDSITNLQSTSNIEFIETEKLEDMLPKGTQNLTLILEPKISGHFQGEINITFTQNKEQKNLLIPLSIFVLPKGTPEEKFQIKNETCEELFGIVCPSGTICNGTATFTKGINPEYCCLASCVQITKDDSKDETKGWIIAILIFILLGGIGYYFYKKQKQIRPQKLEEQLKAKTEKYSKRITGSLTKS